MSRRRCRRRPGSRCRRSMPSAASTSPTAASTVGDRQLARRRSRGVGRRPAGRGAGRRRRRQADAAGRRADGRAAPHLVELRLVLARSASSRPRPTGATAASPRCRAIRSSSRCRKSEPQSGPIGSPPCIPSLRPRYGRDACVGRSACDAPTHFFSTFQNTVTGEATLPLTVLRRAMAARTGRAAR